MPEPDYEPEALSVYRRTLGEAADNEAVILAEDVSADVWIEELEKFRADLPDAEAGRLLNEALDFAAALSRLDGAEAQVEYVGRADVRPPARVRAARSLGTA